MISTQEQIRRETINTAIATSRIASCEAAMRIAGAQCTFVSDSRSRYFDFAKQRIRVSDHTANDGPDDRWDAEIRVDSADWRDALESLVGPPVSSMADIPASVYFADHEAWSQSMLKTFLDRRRLAEAYYITGQAEPPDPTPPMQKGTATHTALLEPDRFDRLVVTYPKSILASNGAVSTKEAKAFRDEHEAAGRVVMKADDFAAVKSMADSVRRVCGKWLDLPGKKEQSIYWTDEISGIKCKARLDWLIERGDRNYVFDLKTTNDASPAGFRKRIEDGYWLQSDHYCAGVEAITNRRTSFIFVAVESAFPFACALHEMDAESIAHAIDGRRRELNNLAACLKSGDFSEPWERIINPIPVRSFAFQGNTL